MPRRSRILFALLALIVLLPVALIVFVITHDWDSARPWVAQRVGDAIGRKVSIEGDLTAAWHWKRGVDGVDTWSPGFRFDAAKVSVGNPDWTRHPQFAELDAVAVDLRLLPLLWRHVDTPTIRLVKPALDFERRKDGVNNWTFAVTGDGESPSWTFEPGAIEFDAGSVTVLDAERGLDVRAEITPLDAPIAFGQRIADDDPTTRREVIRRVGKEAAQRLHKATEDRKERREARGRTREPPPYLFGWSATGTLQGAPLKGTGRFGGAIAIRDPDRPFPLRADVQVGATQIALTGTIVDPTSPDSIDMRLWISGPDLSLLYPIAGLSLPSTPPYATVGRLAGRFRPDGSLLRYEDFTAQVGGSDLVGTLTYTSAQPRPTLTGHVESTLLQVKDLGTLVGAHSSPSSGERSDAGKAPDDKVLPREPFNAERWNAMDTDVKFTGKRVFRERELPIQDVETSVVMKDGVLSLDPLRFGMAGGNVKAALHIDSNTKPPKGRVEIDARKLQLRRLFAKTAGLSDSQGEINGSLRLAGAGPSIGGLLGSSDGSMQLLMTDGKVSEALMEEAGLNIANVLLSKLFGDEQVDIHCAAADFTAKQGVLDANLFVFDTENALIDIDGSISLASETLDLTLHPHTKGIRVLSLRSPLHVTGSFRKADVSVDKKSLLLRAGGAIGLAVVATPLAALLPLIAPSGDDDAKSCGPLVEQLKARRSKR